MQSNQPRQLNEVYCIFDEALLGKGSTGNVYLGCVNGNPAQKVAIKSINLLQISNEVTRYLLSCEIAALSNLGKLQNTQHENIVRLLQIIILDNFIYLVMQLLEGGTLADYIRKHPNGLPEQEAMVILRQILEGYKRIKDKHIVHRDLKPDNILFKAAPTLNKQIAIIDFGYCEMREVPNKPNMFYNVGSPKYMAPEAFKQNKYSQKSDIWAIGVMLYEMLIGKTCDLGMDMSSYLQMLESRGVPLPGSLKNIYKHLLTLMLNHDEQARIQCDQVLKILHVELNSGESSQIVPIRQGNQFLRATMEITPSERPNRNNPIFHSAFLPSPIGPNTSHHSQQPLQIMRMPRSQSRLSEPIQPNMQETHGMPQDPRTSFQNQQRPIKRVTFPQKLMKVENVQFTSVKQIIHRRQHANNLIQLKVSNTSPFSKQGVHFFEHQNALPQNQGQPMMANQRTLMNQVGNQENIKINMGYQIRTANSLPQPNQELTFSKIVHHHPNQQVQVLSNNNQNLKVQINPFQIMRPREIQNLEQSPQMKKHFSEDARLVPMPHFSQQNRRQSEQFMKPYPAQNKIHVVPINQPQINHDLTLTRHHFPDLTQTTRHQQDLTVTRIPQYQSRQPAIQRPDLTQTRLPIQLISNDLTISKAPRGSHKVQIFQKQMQPQNPNSLNAQQRYEYFSQRFMPGRPIQMVREIANPKPQMTTIRNIDNKGNHVRLHPHQEMHPLQQPHLMFLRPNIVK